MAGTHCWNATVQRDVDHAESLAEAAAGSVRAGALALGATVLVPVRLSKSPARPPALATPAVIREAEPDPWSVGTSPQPSHSASLSADAHSPAPRASARQRECTPPARRHSLALSPPRANPISVPFPPKPPAPPPAPPPPAPPPPAQSPPRRRSEVHESLTRRVTISAQQRRSKERMGDRGGRVGMWWPRGEPNPKPAEVHQRRADAAAARGAAVAARAARAAAVGSAALSAGYVRGSPFDGGGCGGGYGDAEGDREGDTEGDGEEGEGPEADEWRWGGDGGAAAIAPPWLRATSLDRPVKPQLDGPAAQSRELLGQLRSTKHGKGGRQPADVTHRRGTAEWNGAMARLARQRVDGDLLAHRSLTRTRTRTPTPTPTRARARARARTLT
jgi:hypothetical protein